MVRDPNIQFVLSSRGSTMPSKRARSSSLSLTASVRQGRTGSVSLLFLACVSFRMRCLFLCLFCLTTMVAQQPQRNCGESAKNEEDNCCCTTYDANMCLSKVQDKADQELNQSYQSALKRWNVGPSTEELRQAQQAWVTYRDATCKAEGNLYKGGTIMPSVEMRCVIRLTRQRIAEIKDAYLFER
jgi:uncharacterized protein YecT (DUF1311 family)